MQKYFHLLALLSAMFGTQLSAEPRDWEASFFEEGCGRSEAAARINAIQKAEKTIGTYRAVCEEESGIFSSRCSEGGCSPYEPTDFECPARCPVYCRVECLN